MGFLTLLFGKKAIPKPPEDWSENKISDNDYLVNIPKEKQEQEKIARWQQDKVEKLLTIEGFHIKEHGRSGFLYFIEKGKFCEIYFELSGVSQYDILVFFDETSEWCFPVKKEITDIEKEVIKEKLVNWLKIKKIKFEL